MVSRIGILTGGGDCPGLNAAIRAVIRRAEQANVRPFGFRGGWKGVLDLEATPLDLAFTRGLLDRGGTVLGTSRVNPYQEGGGPDRVREALEVHNLDGLVVIGGEGTLAAASSMYADGIPLVGVPKTIDNDVVGTELTIGFLTAADIATEAVDRLHSTAESHNRIQVLEVMGRHAGWIATLAGMAGGADAILIPEVPFDIGEVARHIKHRAGSGRDFSIVVVAEGAQPLEGTLEIPEVPLDEFGRPRLGGLAHTIAHELEARTHFEARVTILGHVQRGGKPSAMDRALATRMGVRAANLAIAGDWGAMTALRDGKVGSVPLAEVAGQLKTVPPDLYEVAEVFFG